MGKLDGFVNGALQILRKHGLVSQPKVSTTAVSMFGPDDREMTGVKASLTDNVAERFIVVTVRNTYQADLVLTFDGVRTPEGAELKDVTISEEQERRFMLAREMFMIRGSLGAMSGCTLSYTPIG